MPTHTLDPVLKKRGENNCKVKQIYVCTCQWCHYFLASSCRLAKLKRARDDALLPLQRARLKPCRTSTVVSPPSNPAWKKRFVGLSLHWAVFECETLMVTTRCVSNSYTHSFKNNITISVTLTLNWELLTHSCAYQVQQNLLKCCVINLFLAVFFAGWQAGDC